MPDGTPRLKLPLIQQSQAQKHVTHNEALAILDLLVQLVVQDFGAETPPGGPQDGQVWALGAAPTGAWAGQANRLAARLNGGWEFLAPQPGWRAVSLADGSLRRWTGSAWLHPVPDLGNLPGVGVNTSYDETNRLAVSALATLLTHDGAGHQLKINKAAAGDTASLLFQTDWAGRAEMGTVGDDDFAVKVSADGSAWHVALVVDRATGNVSFPNGVEIDGPLTGAGAEILPSMISSSVDTGVVTTAMPRAVITSVNGRSSSDGATVMGSDNCHASANRTIALVSSFMDVSGPTGAAIAATNGEVSGTRAVAIASQRCDVSGGRSLVAGSLDSVCTSASQGAVIASRATLNSVNGSLAMGNGSSSSQSDASAANRTIHLFGTSGNVQISGALTSGHVFSDFGEMMRNGTGAEIPAGIILAMDGDEVRPAGPGDDIVGVVSHTMAVRAGDTPFFWQGRYLYDEWGRPVHDLISDPDWEAEIPDPDWVPVMIPVFDGSGIEIGQMPAPGQTAPMIPNPSTQEMVAVHVENPDWNPALPQTPRSERPTDWTPVGMLGQVFARVAADVMPGDSLSAVDGIGVKSAARTGLRCMTITQPFDAGEGYAVARCLINIQV